MVAYETYAASLVSKGHGYPLWEPDPGECAPVELADVGYTSEGGFTKLFNASAGIDDPSNDRDRDKHGNRYAELCCGECDCDQRR